MPASLISMLIVFVAVTRWNGYGLITVPFVSLGVILGGYLIGGYYRAVYWFSTDWQFYISIVLGYLAFGANIFIYKRYDTKKILSKTGQLILLLIVDYVLFCGIQYLAYFLLTLGQTSNMIYSYTDTSGNLKELMIVAKPTSGWVYNLFALIVLIVGALILRSQGVVVNAKQKLIDDKRNALLDEEDKKFSIEEVEEDETSSNDESATDESKNE